MRLFLLALSLCPASAFAWEFRPDPVCTLFHDTGRAALTITFDPAQPEYRLDLVLQGQDWTDTPTFGITFDGPRGLTIGTDRHRIDGRQLSVTDRGFGNVLDGLEFNRSATAFTDTQSARFPLDAAAGPVRQFRRCAQSAPATS